MTEEEAEKLFDKYFEGKPLFKQMIDDAQEFAKQHKFIEIPGSGFRRKLLNVDSKDFSEKSKALRQATNTIIQGGSAYLMQCALIIINDFLQEKNIDAKIIVTVHDSMVASTRKELVPLVGAICKQVMENLPLDFLNVTIEGKPVYFKMEADFGVSINYNDECPYDDEMFNQAVSAEGYCSWFMASHVLDDLGNEGLISKEYAEERTQLHEQYKPRYLAVKSLADDEELYKYHQETINLRSDPA